MKMVFRIFVFGCLLGVIILSTNYEMKSVPEPNIASELLWLESSRYWEKYDFEVMSDESSFCNPIGSQVFAYTVRENTYGDYEYNTSELIEHGIDISSLPTHEINNANQTYQLPYIEIDIVPINFHSLYSLYMVMLIISTLYWNKIFCFYRKSNC